MAGALNQIAVTPGLGADALLTINDLRQQLFGLLPDRIQTRRLRRSTSGPSYEDVRQRGFRLGLQAVWQNHEDLLDPPEEVAVQLVRRWVSEKKQHVFEGFVDGSDPEYIELWTAFEEAVEIGISHLLQILRDEY